MNITIYGGGNIGTQFAVHCAEKGHSVVLFTTKPGLFSRELFIVDETKTIIHKGNIVCATDNQEKAFRNADLILVTVPAFMMQEAAEKIRPYYSKGKIIALIPGTGGGECCFYDALNSGCIIMGLQRVPSVARLVSYGQSVCASGYRDTLYVGTLPKNKTGECCTLISGIFDIPCIPLPEYLCVTMTPSNPILHTARLKCIFKDYKSGIHYDSIPLFYEEWNMDSSVLLIKNDQEVQAICKKLSMFDLSGVKSLKKHYESETPEQLTAKIKSIKSLQGLTTPSVKNESGWIPDFHSRFFTADFPYGLEIFVQIGNLANVDIPNLNETLEWYYSMTGAQNHFNYSDYGINSLTDFVNFYSM